MTFDDFLNSFKREPDLRSGQQFMNNLYYERPDIYWVVINENANCFYDDKLLPKAKEVARNYWDK